MFRDAFIKMKMDRFSNNIKPEALAMFDTVVKFFYYVAKKTNIPNNNLMNLINDINLYTYDLGRYDKYSTTAAMLADIYDKLASEYNEHDFRRYMKLDQKDSLIEQFLQ